MTKPIHNASFFAFFHNTGPNFAQILPLKPHPVFLADL